MKITDLVVDRGLRDALWLLRHRLRGRRITEPACRKCGYYVTGLPEPRCPECGADLTKVGVIDPANVLYRPIVRRWALALAVVGIWTIVIILLGVMVLALFVPWQISQFRDVTLRGASGAYGTVSLYGTTTFSRLPWSKYEAPFSQLELRVAPAEDDFPLMIVRIESATAASEFMMLRKPVDGGLVPVPKPESNTLDSYETLLRWMELIGVDTSQPSVREEAEELHAIIQTARNATWSGFYASVEQMPLRHMTTQGWGGYASEHCHLSYRICALVALVLFWGLGIKLLVLRRG